MHARMISVPGPQSTPSATCDRAGFAIGVVAQVTLLWALSYGQTDGVLLLWVRDYTVRGVLGHEISPSAFVAVPPLFVLIWAALAALLGKRCQPSTRNGKLAAGLLSTSLGFALPDLCDHAVRSTPQRRVATCLPGPAHARRAAGGAGHPVADGPARPRRHTGLSYALWYAAAALGLYLAGQLGAQWYTLSPASFFALVAAAPLCAVALIAWTRLLLRDAEERHGRLGRKTGGEAGSRSVYPEPWVPVERICTRQLTQRMGSGRDTGRYRRRSNANAGPFSGAL